MASADRRQLHPVNGPLALRRRLRLQSLDRVEDSIWGLIPYWATDPKIGYKTINARAETVATAPAFRAAFKRRRCLVPASGFYEWKKLDGDKQPYLIQMRDGSPFSSAGCGSAGTRPGRRSRRSRSSPARGRALAAMATM